MGMKKVIIVNNNLHIGGVQKALISLLWNIRDSYDVTLLLFSREGAYCNELPPEVKVICVESAYRYLGMSGQNVRTGRDRLMRSFYAAVSRIFGRKYAIAIMKLGQKPIGEYDAAISYLHNSIDKGFYGGCNEFVLNHISAKKKIAFLHCDYTLCGANTKENNRQYSCFDAIAACSQGCADAFVKANPHLKSKVMVVPNCHRYDRIRAMAENEPVSLKSDKINIVTVARLGKEKGVERAVRAIAHLGGLKDRIHYYIIGDGARKKVLLETLEQEQLQDCVTLCGQLENPYGYIRAADLLLIPSRSEAAPLVIGEAACLGTPVLSTRTSSALEMIAQTGYGWVCENNEGAMTQALVKLLSDPGILSARARELEEIDFHNEKAAGSFRMCVDS